MAKRRVEGQRQILHVEASKVCEGDGGKHEICAGVRPAPVRPQAIT